MSEKRHIDNLNTTYYSVIKIMNDKDPITPSTTSLVYNIIRKTGGINRMGITNVSGVSKSTISLQISKLMNLGLIEEVVPEVSPGQRKLSLRISASRGYVAGVFLGINKLSVIIFNLEMSIIAEKYYEIDDISEPAECNRRIIKYLKELCIESGIDKLWGIGMGFPFPVNFREGKPDSPPNVPLWHGYPLKELYRKEFGCPVLIDNDVNVMALGEGCKGRTSHQSDFLFIKAGTGIGAGLIIDGRIYRGANGCAGDVGHIAVDGSSVKCHCGNIGCLEAEAGGRALSSKAVRKAVSGESSYLEEKYREKGRLSAVDINNGAVSGDLGCIELIQDAGKAVGDVCAKLVNFYNPSAIVIGGGLSGFGNIFIGAIREAVISRSPHLATFELSVCFSDLKEKAGPVGAGTLILDHIFSSENFAETVKNNL